MPRSLSDEEIEEFRTALCDAAERLFGENGYDGVTMRALAAELGCSPMTPYRYFENKDAIFSAVRTAAFIRHGEVFEKLESETRDPFDRLRVYGRAYIAFGRENPNAYRIMFGLSQNTELNAATLADPIKRKEVLRGWAPLVSAMEEIVEAGYTDGDPLDHAHLAWAMLHGLVTLELSHKYLLGRDLDQLIEPSLDTFLRGIGAPPNSSGAGAKNEAKNTQ